MKVTAQVKQKMVEGILKKSKTNLEIQSKECNKNNDQQNNGILRTIEITTFI